MPPAGGGSKARQKGSGHDALPAVQQRLPAGPHLPGPPPAGPRPCAARGHGPRLAGAGRGVRAPGAPTCPHRGPPAGRPVRGRPGAQPELSAHPRGSRRTESCRSGRLPSSTPRATCRRPCSWPGTGMPRLFRSGCFGGSARGAPHQSLRSDPGLRGHFPHPLGSCRAGRPRRQYRAQQALSRHRWRHPGGDTRGRSRPAHPPVGPQQTHHQYLQEHPARRRWP